jgi:acyl carrier protein
VCQSFGAIKARAASYFKSMNDLRAEIASATHANSRHHCLILLSGGKDSTYALCRLVDMGLRVYAFSFDNGYISTQAKENIRRVTDALGVEHEFANTPGMGAIFRESLTRFSNVCNGCFKTIYTLGITRARQLEIPVVVTGLSRGQLFETRLTPDMFRDGFSPEDVDAAVLAARKAYHRTDDAVSKLLDVSLFKDDRVFEEIRILDFYRYCDAALDEILAYLARRVPWIRPADTGRSTNCLANDVGIYVHTRERGYHNYALPYSWDVRMGHKTRQQAVDELHDALDMPRVRRILEEIGYDEHRPSEALGHMVACYVGTHAVQSDELRRHLAVFLPPAMIPGRFVCVDAMPLTENGKTDEAALRALARQYPGDDGGTFVAPAGPVQEGIAGIWSDVLRVDRVGAHTTVFALGGTSLAAMEIALRICREFEVDLPLQTVFAAPTVAQLAEHVEALIVREVAALSDEEAERRIAEAGGAR